MQRQDGPDWGQPFRETRQQMQLLLGLAQVVAMPLSAWTRRFGTWGERYPGLLMAAGWTTMPLFAVFFPAADPGPLLAVWLVTAVMLLLHRIEGVRLRRKGRVVHSLYSGESWVPGDPWYAKQTAEPGVAILLGIFAALECPPLGAWLIAAGLGQGLTVALAYEAERAAVREARDARLRAEYEMGLLRRELGED